LEWTVFANYNYEFLNYVYHKSTTARIPMLDLTGEVGDNGVEVQRVGHVDVLDGG